MPLARTLSLLASTVVIAGTGLALAGQAGAATRYLAPGGSDASDCSDPAAPCVSLDRGYHAAQPGDVVELADGAYPGQGISADPTKTAGPDVVITPAAGASVSFTGRVTLRAASFLTLKDLTFSTGDPWNDLLLGPCNRDLLLENVSGTRFVVEGGNRNVTFHGGSWGGYTSGQDSAIGGDASIADAQTCGTGVNQPSRNILFDGVTWHDVYWISQCASGTYAAPCIQSNGASCTPAAPENSPGGPCVEWGGAHPDCFEIDGDVDGLTIQNSTFVRCGDSFLAVYGDELGPVENVTIKNNTFADGDPFGFWSIQLSDAGHKYSCGGLTFAGNTFHTNNPNNPNTDFVGGPVRISCSGASSSVTGNTFESGSPDPVDCALLQKNAVWDGNTYTIWYPCGGHALLGNPAQPVTPTVVALCGGAQCMFSYLDPVTVSLVPTVWSSPVTQIRYTLDGSDPNGAGALIYTAPFLYPATARLQWTATDGTSTQPTNNQDIGFDTFVVGPGAQHAYLNGSTLWFAGALGGSFRVSATFADINGPNPTHVSFGALAAAGWSHAAEDVTTGPPFLSSPYSWTAGAAAPQAQIVAGFDAAGNERDDAVKFVDDSAAPATTISCNGGACASTFTAPATIALASADAGSGVARILYTLDGSNPSTSATALVYSVPFPLTASATVKWSAIDRVGNAEAVGTQAVSVQSPAGSGAPDLKLVLSADGAVPDVGGELLLHATVSDRAGRRSASGVVVAIQLPGDLKVVRTSTDRGTGCRAYGSTLICNLGSIAPGADGHVDIWTRVDEARVLRVGALVRADGPDANWLDNVALLTLQPAPPPRLLAATHVTGRAVVGGQLSATAPAWSSPATSVRYQWERCSERECDTIRGANGSTLTLTRADADHRVRVVAMATAGGRAVRSASEPVTVKRR